MILAGCKGEGFYKVNGEFPGIGRLRLRCPESKLSTSLRFRCPSQKE